MTPQMPVVAAIPNYNMADSLRRLLPQILEQNYDRVFVLDDKSTDDTVDVIGTFGGDVTLVRSPQNRGAGANRNQIIDHVDDNAIIHFIDADMNLETKESPTVARELMARYSQRDVGLVGGLVRRADGSQELDNYGAVFSLWGNTTALIQLLIDRLRHRPKLARAIRQVTAPLVTDWPNVLAPPRPAPAYWVHEGNMLVYSRLFRSIGGYDPALREHEIQDLAIRLEKQGVRRQFDPSIRVTHTEVNVRGSNRQRSVNQAALYLLRKHGIVRFLTDH